jgi:hypothetical protein
VGLVDAAGGRKNLDGTVAGGGVVQVTAAGALELGNQGDTVVRQGRSGSSKQYTPGSITCGICGQEFQPCDPASGHEPQGGEPLSSLLGSSGGVEADPGLVGQADNPLGS